MANPLLARYMAMRYPIELHHDPPGWFARIPDLDGCCTQGETVEETLANLEEAKEGWIECRLEGGYSVPAPCERLVPHRTDVRPALTQECFDALVAEWRRDTAHLSSTVEAVEHLAHQEIISYGAQALPFIFADLAKEAHHWFVALRELTGQNPVPEELRGSGNIRAMAAAWLEWGREKGYVR